jgi:hypothetical protein
VQEVAERVVGLDFEAVREVSQRRSRQSERTHEGMMAFASSAVIGQRLASCAVSNALRVGSRLKTLST